jgi:hypothetical protein
MRRSVLFARQRRYCGAADPDLRVGYLIGTNSARGALPMLLCGNSDFEVIELDGQDHIGALAETDLVAARLLAALDRAGL